MGQSKTIRVLYSFPQKLGAARVAYTAWEQVKGLAAAGAAVQVFPGVLHKAVPKSVRVWPTLAWGRFRISYKLLGMERACALHDWVVSRRIQSMSKHIDILHAWPLAAMRTLKVAAQLGIPTVLERPNAHTRFAYTAVQAECKRLGINLPPGNEHAYNAKRLEKEEQEYRRAYRLLCPSDFVKKTFLDEGFSPSKLARHNYGFDQEQFYPSDLAKSTGGLKVLFVGVCAVRKGLHFALAAWLRSSASSKGTFQIAGDFLPAYLEKLAPLLTHPSIKVLGHRQDVADLMRASDVLVLPSIEEGSALVTSEARGCGCVLLVSNAAGANCQHMKDALVHQVGDVKTLADHMSLLHCDRALLAGFRAASLRTVNEITWTASGKRLAEVYRQVLADYASEPRDTSLFSRP